ncbi:Rrf2 family transcriptional regulator [Halobacteriovorax sp.]|uniref:RrF2 family transcriptional regulator n=1 Tax=Halobacteriovorax sp. TaxID=2020862 RepID=UPI0035620D2D
MLKVNKKVEYALMALKFMVEKGDELTSAREICDHFRTPFDTTAKVMQVMNSHNILNSVKGIKGGYTVSTDLSKISYLTLARMIEAKEVKSICQTNKGLCELHCDCNIVNPMSTLSEKLNQFLDSLSIQELLFGEEFSDTNKLCPIKDIVKDINTNGTQV